MSNELEGQPIRIPGEVLMGEDAEAITSALRPSGGVLLDLEVAFDEIADCERAGRLSASQSILGGAACLATNN